MSGPVSALNETSSVYASRRSFTLDSASNRTAVRTRDGASSSPSTETYTVDAAGNLTWDGQHYFKYDYRNRLCEVYVVDVAPQSGGRL